MFESFEPRHWIALFVLTGGFILLAMGYNSYITAMLTLVVGYFFGYEKINPNIIVRRK